MNRRAFLSVLGVGMAALAVPYRRIWQVGAQLSAPVSVTADTWEPGLWYEPLMLNGEHGFTYDNFQAALALSRQSVQVDNMHMSAQTYLDLLEDLESLKHARS